MKKYLESSKYINWSNPEIKELAKLLSSGLPDKKSIAKNCFEWVRDNIRHSSDYKLNPVTCKASDVLIHKTGYCYAKSHLLAALLRANNIPAGLCYQRLSVEDDGAPYCLPLSAPDGMIVSRRRRRREICQSEVREGG